MTLKVLFKSSSIYSIFCFVFSISLLFPFKVRALSSRAFFAEHHKFYNHFKETQFMLAAHMRAQIEPSALFVNRSLICFILCSIFIMAFLWAFGLEISDLVSRRLPCSFLPTIWVPALLASSVSVIWRYFISTFPSNHVQRLCTLWLVKLIPHICSAGLICVKCIPAKHAPLSLSLSIL